MLNTVIRGSGSYIPEVEVENDNFIQNTFYFNDGKLIDDSNQNVIQKFKDITGINTRRYVNNSQSCSDIGAIAARKAIEDAGIDPEQIDMIIVAHNFGDVIEGSNQTDILPSIASRIKHNLGIKNEFCIPYDILFGCPGWIQGLIQAHMFMKSEEVNRCLVIGSEVLSRVIDPFDRDTMIFADGAGAVLLENSEEDEKRGILSHAAVSHTSEEVNYLHFGKSNNLEGDGTRYMKMLGHKIYQYALTEVPKAMKHCIDKAGLNIKDVKKILIHQANEKMDDAIVKRLFRLYGLSDTPEGIMPMTISSLGNSSVATVPTLYDLITKNQLADHEINKGDIIMFASVGAGMNINCIAYKA